MSDFHQAQFLRYEKIQKKAYHDDVVFLGLCIVCLWMETNARFEKIPSTFLLLTEMIPYLASLWAFCFGSLSRGIGEGKSDELRENAKALYNKEMQIARALTLFTLDGYTAVNWFQMREYFSDCLSELKTLKNEVFDAMAWFVWNLYDKEDFENVAFAGELFNQCERIRESVINSQLDLASVDVSDYENIREQDLCNILQWCVESENGSKDFPDFKNNMILFHWVGLPVKNFERYAKRAREIMLASDNLDPKGAAKKQLRFDLLRGKCVCIVDALYLQSWKRVNIQNLEAKASDRDTIEWLLTTLHEQFYYLYKLRHERFRRIERIVTYPLSGKIYGSWDEEVEEIIIWADLKRRCEGCRFIGAEHILFCLHQMLLPKDKLEHARHNNKSGYLLHIKSTLKHKLLPSCMNSQNARFTDSEEKRKDTVYHIYQKADAIAKALGDETIGLEHLYTAITSGTDDERYWKHVVECVRVAKGKRRGQKSELDDETHISPWEEIGGKRGPRNIEGSSIEFVKKVQDDRYTPMISSILNKVENGRRMPGVKLATSLKRYLKIK